MIGTLVKGKKHINCEQKMIDNLTFRKQFTFLLTSSFNVFTSRDDFPPHTRYNDIISEPL